MLTCFHHPDFHELYFARTRLIHFNLTFFFLKTRLSHKKNSSVAARRAKVLAQQTRISKTLNFFGRYIFFCTINTHSSLTRRSRSTAFLPVLRDAFDGEIFIIFQTFSSRASHNAFYSFHDRKRNGEKFLFLRGEKKFRKKTHRQSRTRFQSLKHFIEIFSWVN